MLAMPSYSSEALLIAILKECSQSANGHPFRRTAGVIQDLANNGLVVVASDGRVVTTDKGKAFLGILVSAKEERRNRRKRRFLH
jgi:predicted transcriptional regulator